MGSTRIHPEKITHPISLMAAWFALLVLLVGELLFAATQVKIPAWIPALLSISAIGLSLIIIILVFIMLTKYRPHLQGPKEYAEWLKDERKYRGVGPTGFMIPRAREPKPDLTQTMVDEGLDAGDVLLFKQIVTCSVSISWIVGANEVQAALVKLGFNAEIYREPQDRSPDTLSKVEDHTAIWIGARVPSRVAMIAIKTVIKIWPHLCYLHISTDGMGSPPDYIHDQIYFGGATRTAVSYGLKKWSIDEIDAIPDDIGTLELHERIRSRYL